MINNTYNQNGLKPTNNAFSNWLKTSKFSPNGNSTVKSIKTGSPVVAKVQDLSQYTKAPTGAPLLKKPTTGTYTDWTRQGEGVAKQLSVPSFNENTLKPINNPALANALQQNKPASLGLPNNGVFGQIQDLSRYKSYLPGQTGTSGTTPAGVTQPNVNGGGSFSGSSSGGYSNPSVTGLTPTGTTQPVKTGTAMDSTKGVLDYNNMLKDLQRASKPSKEQRAYLDKLTRSSQRNEELVRNAEALAGKYGAEISRVGQLGAGAVAGNLSTGSNVVGSGNAAIASQSASSRMQALSQALNAELQGTQTALTGQAQSTDALNAALGGANTQQQAQIGGLSNVAGYGQPVQIAPGSTLTSPVGGQTVAGGLGGYVNYQTAEQVMGLISQYPDAGYAYNADLTPQQNLALAQQAIQSSPTYQRTTFGAPGATSYIGGAQLQSAGELTGQMNLIQAQGSGADANFQLLLNIAKSGGVNSNTVPILNTIEQNVKRGLVSSEAVTTFNSVLQSVRAQYAAILGGGTPTDASRREAEAQIPKDISIGALENIHKALSAEVNNRVSAYNQQIQGLQNTSGGGYYGGGTISWDSI